MDKIGRYEIERELGRGGMAIVYLARDPLMDRQVAVKVLPRQFTFDENFRQRFQREVKLVAALEHPAIVPVHDFGEQDDQLFLVMRYMPGGSLADRLQDGPLALPEAARIFNWLAPALDAAHSQGMVHRDLKPDNILFDQWDRPYLADFGIAKLVAGSETALTVTGGLVGTPAYMSPEQVIAQGEIDSRSDIYALGVILFQMLTGDIPYKADTPMGLAFMHVNTPVPTLVSRRPGLPAAAQAVIEQAMAKEPNGRFDSAVALSQAVATLAGQPAPPAPPPAAKAAPTTDATQIESPPPRPAAKEPTTAAPPPAPTPQPPAAQPTPSPAPDPQSPSPTLPTWLLPAAGIIGVCLVAAVLLMWLGGSLFSNSGAEEIEPAEEAATEVVEEAAEEPAEELAEEPAEEPVEEPAAEENIHIVQAGETLARIALAYGVSMDAIIEANGISNPNTLEVGQALIIPPPGPEPEPGLYGEILERGVIRIGVAASEVWPLNVYDGDDHYGFEIDLARELVERLYGGQVEIEWVPVNAVQRFPFLQDREIDMLIRYTTHTRTREEELGIVFSDNYFLDGQRMLVRADSGIQEYAELDGGVICVTAGTTTEVNLFRYFSERGFEYIPWVFELSQDGWEYFLDGGCDAYTTDWSTLMALNEGNSAYRVIGELIPWEVEGEMGLEPYGIGLPPGEFAFRDEVNAALTALIDEGIWQSIYDEWIQDPPPWTVEEMRSEPRAER